MAELTDEQKRKLCELRRAFHLGVPFRSVGDDSDHEAFVTEGLATKGSEEIGGTTYTTYSYVAPE
jgi:hypothetical protein